MKHPVSTVMSKYWSIVVVFALTPLLLYAALLILPTFDDWTSLTRPSFEPLFTKKTFLFFGYHWRPFDAIIGYILGLNPQLLFPTFNHFLVVFGHVACAVLVYRLLSTLGYSRFSVNVATAFYFIAPATMATVLAVDSMNQTYALLWGMVSFLFYLKPTRRGKYLIWGLIVFIAALCKENGLMWALICPVLAYGYDFIDKKTLKKDLLIGIAVLALYAIAILVFPKEITIHPEYVPDHMKVVRNCVKFLFISFVTFDYVWLLHQPHRNLILAAITLLLSLPFLYFVFIRHIKVFVTKKMVCTILCLVIAVSPHILTVFSMMHTYAGLPFIAILMAQGTNEYTKNSRPFLLSFLLFILTSLCIDVHLWYLSWQSGLVGKEMAKEAIKKTHNPVNHVYVIIIEEEYEKLSSFCVIPYEAFGWGLASQYETNYQWPQDFQDTTIERSADAVRKAQELGRLTLKDKKYDCVWIVNHSHIDVLK
jgi:hypothetical protein